MIGVLLTFFLKQHKSAPKKSSGEKLFFSFLKYWKTSSASYKRVTAGLILFATLNSSDIFSS